MAQTLIGSLRVSLGLDSAQFNKGVKSATDKLRDTGKKMRNIGAGLSVAVTAPLALAAKEAVGLFNVQDAAMTKVRQGVESTGGAAGKTADELFNMASALQEATTFGDEAILDGVTAQLLTFTNISGEAFDRTQQAALDLSTVLGTDLKSTTIQLGKALNDPVANLGALGRAGIQFSDEQTEVIKSLSETGRLAEAQSMILDELSKQYGGQAAAAAATFGGQTQQLSNSFGDLKEEFGAIISEFLPPLVEGLKRLVSFLQGVNPNAKKMAVIIAGLAAVIGPIVGTIGLFTIGIAAISAPVLAVVAAVAALTAGFIAFGPEIMAAKDAVVQFGKDALEYIKGLPAQIVEAFASLPAKMLEIGGQIMQGLTDGIKAKFSAVTDTIGGVASGLTGKVKGIFGIQSPSRVFKEIGGFLMQGLQIGIDEGGGGAVNSATRVTDNLTSTFSNAFKSILFEGKSFRSELSGILGGIGGGLIDSGINTLVGGLGNVVGGALGFPSAASASAIPVASSFNAPTVAGPRPSAMRMEASQMTLTDNGTIMATVQARMSQNNADRDRSLPGKVNATRANTHRRTR